jgi:MinD superfamily P-loop ATPase
MKQLVILSGKGGTGKTSVAAALADLAARERSLILADADVDAANLELLLQPQQTETRPFMGDHMAVISAAGCTSCGRCHEVCRFAAIRPGPDAYSVDAQACEGCAACFYACPEQAIQMRERQAGEWFRSQTRFGPLFHAHLFAGQGNSGKLVTLLKSQARQMAVQEGQELLLVDGPPGIGCPVIAASSGANLALLVTEPSLSAAHDLERALATLAHFRVPALVCINKADLNPARAEAVAAWCAERGIPVVGRLPYDEAVTRAMVQGQPVTAYQPEGAMASALRELWAQARQRL